MLPFISLITFLVFTSLAAQGIAPEVDVKDITGKAQQEAAKYKDKILEIERQVQDKKQCPITGGSCFKEQKIDKSTASSNNPSPLLEDKNPIIFVSANVPIQSLKILGYQAIEHKAKLVIRGMVKGSMQETAHLSSQIDCPLDIDPKLFKTYSIQKVPTFLIFSKNVWHKVSGNVDLLYALSKAQGRGE